MSRLNLARLVNAKVNREVAYQSDMERLGLADYWPTTAEARGLAREDCDGQAIAKAALLWDEHGFGQDELNLCTGLYRTGGPGRGWSGHMLCLWWAGGSDPWVLDNGCLCLEPTRLSRLAADFAAGWCFNRRRAWRLHGPGTMA